MSRRKPKPDGYLVEVVLDSGQRLHSDPFGEFELDRAKSLFDDLLARTMVERVAIFRIGTGEVVRECDKAWTRTSMLAYVSVPRDTLYL